MLEGGFGVSHSCGNGTPRSQRANNQKETAFYFIYFVLFYSILFAALSKVISHTQILCVTATLKKLDNLVFEWTWTLKTLNFSVLLIHQTNDRKFVLLCTGFRRCLYNVFWTIIQTGVYFWKMVWDCSSTIQAKGNKGLFYASVILNF